MGTQGEGGQGERPQEKEPCRHLDPGLQAPRTARKRISIASPPGGLQPVLRFLNFGVGGQPGFDFETQWGSDEHIFP